MRLGNLLLSLRLEAGLALLLFLPAGTWRWAGAWVFLLIVTLGSWAITARLARHDPGLLAERRGRLWQRDQPLADKIFMLAMLMVGAFWLMGMGLDAGRLHWSSMPLALQILGAIGLVISVAVIDRVMQTNSFAAPVVKLQRERHQRVVRNGLYAYVRHPMYSGAVIAFFSVPFLLGSAYGLIGALAMTILFAIRIGLEERILLQGLPDYAEYQRMVPHRLLPHIW